MTQHSGLRCRTQTSIFILYVMLANYHWNVFPSLPSSSLIFQGIWEGIGTMCVTICAVKTPKKKLFGFTGFCESCLMQNEQLCRRSCSNNRKLLHGDESQLRWQNVHQTNPTQQPRRTYVHMDVLLNHPHVMHDNGFELVTSQRVETHNSTKTYWKVLHVKNKNAKLSHTWILYQQAALIPLLKSIGDKVLNHLFALLLGERQNFLKWVSAQKPQVETLQRRPQISG